MENQFDELTKALAGGLTRREALTRIAGGFAGALLASMGLGKAWGQSPNAAPNAYCEKFCRYECEISPGGGNAFGQCVSSCENCLNSGNFPTGCPAEGSTAVVCSGTCPGDCGANPCGLETSCGSSSGVCVCAETLTPGCACVEPVCLPEAPLCDESTPCPSGFACIAQCCNDVPTCVPLCGSTMAMGLASPRQPWA